MLLRESVRIHHRVEHTTTVSHLSATPTRNHREATEKATSSVVTKFTSNIERVQIRTIEAPERRNVLCPPPPSSDSILGRRSISCGNSDLLRYRAPTSIAGALNCPPKPIQDGPATDNSNRISAIENKLATDAAPPAPRIFQSIKATFEGLQKAWIKNDDGKRAYGKLVPGLIRCVLMSPFWLIGLVYAGPRSLADNIHQWAIDDLKSDTPNHSKLFWGASSLLSVPIRLTIPMAILTLHLTTGIGGLAVTLFLEAVVISEEAVKSTEGRFQKMMIYRAIEDLVYGFELLSSCFPRS
ncbi:MAG: hypothetical protein VYA34_03415 [Myxococcota bacterium]|nr:hypothetical protein [Myxococcota bacterium]